VVEWLLKALILLEDEQWIPQEVELLYEVSNRDELSQKE
jgi:hypothetical protein